MFNLCAKLLTAFKNKKRGLYRLLFLFIIASSFISDHGCSAAGDVVWSVNAGGEAHTDVHGVHFKADTHKTGTSSDYGKSLVIQRVVPQDQILYQTERYHTATFGYEMPLAYNGEFVLVLKFCEVWFTQPNQKVFDVVVNGEHTVVSELDIFSKVGRGVAHDEIIPFSIKNGKLKINGETSEIENGKFTVEFVKGDNDNPKINAMYVMRGTEEDVPKLPPLPGTDSSPEEDVEEEDEPGDQKPLKSRRPSGPKSKDPYASDDTSTMLLPVFIAIGAFIPLLFCLCKV